MRQVVEAWPVSDIYVGCSGNFTVERVLADLNRFRMHSCDVTIYTSVIGAFLSGQPFRMELRDEWREDFDWLLPYLTGPVDRVATVMLATRLVEGLQRDGSMKQ